MVKYENKILNEEGEFYEKEKIELLKALDNLKNQLTIEPNEIIKKEIEEKEKKIELLTHLLKRVEFDKRKLNGKDHIVYLREF